MEVTSGPLEGIRGILLRKDKRHRLVIAVHLIQKAAAVEIDADAGEHKTYNLDGTEKVTIKQIAETIQKVIGNVKIEYVPARPGDFGGKEVSSQLAKTDLGWEPKVGFEEGVRRYVRWFKDRKERRDAEWAALDHTLS